MSNSKFANKLTHHQINEVIKKYVCGEKIANLTKDYHVTSSNIYRLLKYRHVPIRPAIVECNHRQSIVFAYDMDISRYQLNAVYSKTCKRCRKQFTTDKYQQQYCSDDCIPSNRKIYRYSHCANLKHEVIQYLGGNCVRCGNDDYRVLQLNHLNGGGCRENGEKGSYRIRKEILMGLRKHEFDLRCANCNIIYEYERGARTVPPQIMVQGVY